jgi:hypothetical protein
MTKAPRSPANVLIQKLRQDLADIADHARAADLSPISRKKLNVEIERGTRDLNKLLAELDPIKRPQELFDPGNPRTIRACDLISEHQEFRMPRACRANRLGNGGGGLFDPALSPHLEQGNENHPGFRQTWRRAHNAKK